MPYAERLAESYLAAKEAERNNGTAGEDPLFKLIAGDSKEFVGGIPKQTWDGMTPDGQKSMVSIPPRIQTIMRGTGAAVVGAPFAVGGTIAGAAAGAGIGGAVGGPAAAAGGAFIGGIAGGAAGGNFGGTIGTEVTDSYIQDYNKSATPPAPQSRDILYREYQAAKSRD